MKNHRHTFFSIDKNSVLLSSRINLFLIKGFPKDSIMSYDVLDTKLSDHKTIQLILNPQLKELKSKSPWILN
uniref:Uncharacterized protein n=1 Tax=Lepeophtheirus salmonis TaxID=72036 RepID=A0A0K2T890_LEPSM